ncbi:MAG: AraC family transcriptional regulator [Phycisphaerae bacterium]|nr:AraC family transcriptional regulator [Phycisphaerae bacterium]
MKDDTKATYQERILKVLLHIQNNFYKPLSLEELASIACFSPYHFHRIFRGMVGETLAEHVRRLRLERAAQLLGQTRRSITDLAFEAGYETVESFTRAFKARFGMAPSAYKKANGLQAVSKLPDLGQKGELTMDVQIKEIPPRRMIFVRHIGPYHECGKAWEKLCLWAGPKGLLRPGVEFIGRCHDDPDITPAEKIRYDACITVDSDIETEGEIGIQTVGGGLYAMTTHYGSYAKLNETYAKSCGQWAPANHYEIRSLPSLEIYLNSPEDTPEDELLTDVYIPIEKQ